MSDSPNTSPAGTKRGAAEYFAGTAWVTMLAGENPTDCTVATVAALVSLGGVELML